MKTCRRIISCIMVVMMLIGMLSMLLVNVASADQGSSTITLTMSDSYGDGWNGNAIEVYVNGVNSGRYTVSSGSSATHSISYDSTNTYEFKWVKGSYASECSFTIKLDGATLLTASKTQCGSYSNNYNLLTIEKVQEEEEDETQYDLEGEFAGGTGTTADPYLIATKAQLNNVRKYTSAHFRQVKNIVFTAADFGVSGDFYNEGKGWEPIGSDYNTAFFGSYDGNGYTIDGLTITSDASQTSYVGLFGYMCGDIVNVRLTNIDYTVTGYAIVGGIVGEANYNEIIGCSVSGSISAEGGAVGGIVGNCNKVEHCESNVFIDIVDETMIEVGGIVGYTSGNTKYCKNNGNITVSGESDTYVFAGGIAGNSNGDIVRCENNGTVSSNGYAQVGGIVGGKQSTTMKTISECVNRGKVSAVYPTYLSYVGGIIGEAAGYTINNCYVTNTVTITSSGTSTAAAGGIAGIVWDESSITNCYSLVNSVSVNTGASSWGRGGIAGQNHGTVEKCYYRYTYGVGYNAGTSSATRVSTLSSYESKSTYSGFDFTSVWEMGTGTYKYAVLRMERGHVHSLSYNAPTVSYESAGNLENWYCSTCQSYFRNSAGTRYVTTDMLEADPLSREGECGTDVTWKLTYEGELSIFGIGKMDDYTDANPAPWYNCRENIKLVAIEQGVTGIGNNAFKGCTNLTRVALGDSLETVGDSAFSECSNITQLRIPQGVTSVGDKAFSSIANLIICFEGGAPSFGGTDVFLSTSAAVYYPSDDNTWTADVMQEQTGSVTWTSYTSLDDIIIASGEFYAYSGDINWTLSLLGKLTAIGEYSSVELQNYNFSNRPAWEPYKDIITSVELVKIVRVGNYAFYEYPALKSINFGIVNEVGASAFYGCSELETVFLENFYGGVTIEKYAFASCSSLKQAAFPKSTTIEDYAFSGCSQLDDIYITTYAEYGGTPMSPSSNGFYGVTATVHVPVNWKYFQDYGDFGGDLSWQAVAYGPCGSDAFWSYDANTSTITITGTGSIASYHSGSAYPWYSLYPTVTKVIFEDGVTYIPNYVFEYMSNIQTVILPNTLQKLACNAFNNCSSLNNLVIPASVTSFEKMGYFNRCDSLTDVYYMGTAQEWSNIENNTVVGSSYDYISNIHYLVLTEEVSATCTLPGIEAYYQFDDTSLYSGYYNLDKQPIACPEVIQALGHDTVYHEAKSSTCTEIGWNAYVICSRCEYSTYEEISATGHSYNEVITAPTCIEDGYTTYICHCGDAYTADPVDALGHRAGEVVVENNVASTCTAEGSYDNVVYCFVCDAELWRETIVVPVIEHDYEVTVTIPTCTEAGYTTRTCKVCHVTYVGEEKDALGHTIVTDAAVEPTCEFTGFTEGKHCSVCNEVLVAQTVVDALGHRAGEVVVENNVASTCTAEGSYDNVVYCFVCDAELWRETIVVPAIDHDYEVTVTIPTCTEAGYTTRTCKVCHVTYVGEEKDALGHRAGEVVVENNVASTCTAEGSYDNVVYCTECVVELSREKITIDALGHSWSSWHEVLAPTCEENGLDQRYCTTCYYTESQSTDPHGHIETITEAVPATCANTGLTEGKHCEKCGEILVAQEIIPLAEHDQIISSGYEAPTCTQSGLTAWEHCSRCNTYLVEPQIIPAYGHTIVIDEGVPATCEMDGLTEGQHCSVCNEILVAQKVIPALGHDWTGEWEVISDATCTEYGSMYLSCSICYSTIATEVIIPYGHTEVIDYAVVPTCTEDGLTQGSHCAVCNVILVEQKVDPAFGHCLGEWENFEPPLCESYGWDYATCVWCGDYMEWREIEPTGHSRYVESIVYPTCTERGYVAYRCSVCNEGEYVDYIDALGHSFTNYVSDNNATITSDGTKTAKCDRCDEKDTVVDEGSALGKVQKFRDEVANLNQNANNQITYSELYAVLQTYASLSAKEKRAVEKEFATLQRMINTYNTKAQTANNELAKATEIAWGPIAVTSFAFLSALWFLLRKKFLV